MKIICLILVAQLVFWSTSFALEEKRTELYFDAGLSFPSQPREFLYYWNMGFNVGGGLGYAFSPSLSLVGHIDYNNFTFNEDNFLEDNGLSGLGININGGSASIITVSGNLKVNLIAIPNSVSPYFICGIGYFSLSTNEVSLSVVDESIRVKGNSESATSVSFGAGIDFQTNATLDIFIEAKYSIGFTEEESTYYLPFRAGIKAKL